MVASGARIGTMSPCSRYSDASGVRSVDGRSICPLVLGSLWCIRHSGSYSSSVYCGCFVDSPRFRYDPFRKPEYYWVLETVAESYCVVCTSTMVVRGKRGKKSPPVFLRKTRFI